MVVITAIPSELTRAGSRWNQLSYLEFSLNTWRFWCARHGVTLFLLDAPVPGAEGMPPTFQRHFALEVLASRGIRHDQVALVDADTMIRWDAPDFFQLTGGRLAAVHDVHFHWIHRSIAAYQGFYPRTRLDWSGYFNMGLVVINRRHRSLMAEIPRLYRRRRTTLEQIWCRNADVGHDQTLFNFALRRADVPVTVLPHQFNFGHCIPSPPGTDPVGGQSREEVEALLAEVSTFDFVEMAHVWHFNGLHPGVRAAAMETTWNGIARFYRGRRSRTAVTRARSPV